MRPGFNITTQFIARDVPTHKYINLCHCYWKSEKKHNELKNVFHFIFDETGAQPSSQINIHNLR